MELRFTFSAAMILTVSAILGMNGCSSDKTRKPASHSAKSSQLSESDGGDNPISNFHEVTPDNRCLAGVGAGTRAAGTIFRGARPEEDGLKYLQSLRIKTILNFDTEDNIQDEQDLIKQDSLTFNEIPHPMADGMGVNHLPNGDVDNDSIIAAIADMRKSQNFPEYVHCQFGQDRTGMTVALHRVFNECWSADDAEHEWNEIEGWWHHLWQIPKHDYFHEVMNNPELRKYYQDHLLTLVPATGLSQPEAAPSSVPSSSPSSVPSPGGSNSVGQPVGVQSPSVILKEPGIQGN